MGAKKNNYLTQGLILAVAGIVTRFIGMLYRIPLTNIVGNEGMGYYSTAYEVYNIALLVSTYSIPVAISKIISSGNAKGRYADGKRVFKVGLVFSSFVGLVVSLVLFFFADPIARSMGYPSATLPLKVLSPTIFVFSCMGVIRGFFQGLRNMVPTAVSQVVEQIVNAVVSVACAVWFIDIVSDASKASLGAAGGTTGTLAGAVAGLIFLILFMIFGKNKKDENAKTSVADESVTPYGKILWILIITMVPIIMSQTIYQLSGITDDFMFGRILGTKGIEESGRAVLFEAYANKYKWLYNLPVAVASAFGVSVVPVLSNAFAVKDTEGIKDKIKGTVRLNMMIAIPAAVGLSFFAGPIMNLFFGKDGELAAKILCWGGIAVIVFAYSTLTNGVLQGINRLSVPVIHSAVSLAIHIPLLASLLYFTDLNEYALMICNILYALVVCILNYRSIKKEIGYRQEIRRTFMIPILSALIMGLFGRCVYQFLVIIGVNVSVGSVISIIVCVPVYFTILIVSKGVVREELEKLPFGSRICKLFTKMKLFK
ncbi:MAG: polysaccharide biosynthesis protein [Lachnospiraceae bacterium]|nr:polysaccharide biosynthesis protein [Lachnospiraceae bacterium]MCR5521414.1 polysaccharide biosynthesis protein [Lachnospiraceae bacterium]